MLDPTIRWTDRLQSSSGDWSGNLCDFYFRAYNKICLDIKTPFAMQGWNRIEDTPVHKALREALANCLINADYYGTRGVVIKKEPKRIVFENPGYIRTGKVQMRKEGESDPRNKSLMKMFNLINIGERSGSGVPNIFNTWEDAHWKEPIIEERFDPDRTILMLEFVKKQAKKASEESKRRKISDSIKMIYEYLAQTDEAKTNDIADYLGLSAPRTRVILAKMDGIEAVGTNTNRKYRLKK